MGIEEIETEDVELETIRRLKRWRAQRYIRISWSRMRTLMLAAGTDRSTRLLMVLVLLEKLDQVQSNAGWIKLRGHILKDLELDQTSFCAVVNRLEKKGVIETKRSPGKRPLIRMLV
jgi:DNA-binding MarR family transcriptional regulator